MEFLERPIFWVGLLVATVQLAAPLLCASLGETIGERAGVLNIGLEGTMLSGAWVAFLGAYYTGSDWLGLLAGMAAGAVVGFCLSYICVSRGADQIITGIAINLFVMGLTSFVFRTAFSTTLPVIHPFQALHIPVAGNIPLIGPIVFQQSWVVYIAFFLVPIVAFVLYKTHFGLAVRAVGESPDAADAVGLRVRQLRYMATIAGASLAGLGGAALSVGQLSEFTDNLTAGRGFLALAIVVVGRWDPWKVAAASLLFAFGDGLQLRLQIQTGVPPQFLQMIPYILAILLMTGLLGRVKAPRSLAVFYSRH